VVVKRLVSIEDLGNIVVLFTDKTGTLTEGHITFAAALDADGSDCLSSRPFPSRTTDLGEVVDDISAEAGLLNQPVGVAARASCSQAARTWRSLLPRATVALGYVRWRRRLWISAWLRIVWSSSSRATTAILFQAPGWLTRSL
jgi:hypothetical protein